MPPDPKAPDFFRLSNWRDPDFLSARKAELACAIGFLTRFPPALKVQRPALANCVWAFPVAGALVGVVGALVLGLAGVFGVPGIAAGFLAVGAMVLASGCLHEDGLADCADGLGGGFTRERALEIMRDSRIGTYGTVVLLVILGIRAAAFGALCTTMWAWLVPISVAAFGRANCGLVLGVLKPARKDGLGATAGQPDMATILVGYGIAGLLALIFLPTFLAILSFAVGLLPVAWLMWRANVRLGGQTGDVAGAASLLGETAVLLVLSSALAGG